MTGSSARAEATTLLEAAETGEAEAATLDRLFLLVYDELRALAHWQLLRERTGHTLSSTALVHEAYVRLVDDTRVARNGRAYFFAAAARAMRQVLVDYARKRRAAKRGGGQDLLSLDASEVSVDRFADELIDLDHALEHLAALNARQAHVVECRFFGGLELEETADALGVSVRTVKRDWALARAWLYDALHAQGGP
jgi:RNA polymerase sigma factor (TIGR02999 family)